MSPEPKKNVSAMATMAASQTTVNSFFTEYQGQISKALPSHMKADRMTRIFLTALTKNPKLGECSTLTLFNACVQCSELGVEPNGRDAHLVPFGGKITVIVDYKGMIKLARRSGEVSQLVAVNIYENEHYVYREGLDRTIEHTPMSMSERGEKIIATYAVCVFKDKNSDFEWMWSDELEAIRDASANYSYAKNKAETIWVKHDPEMRKKTVIRRFSKRLPLSEEFVRLAEHEETPIGSVDDLKTVDKTVTLDDPDKEPWKDGVEDAVTDETGTDKTDGDPGLGKPPPEKDKPKTEPQQAPVTRTGWRSKATHKELGWQQDGENIILRYMELHGVAGKKVPNADFGSAEQMEQYLAESGAFEKIQEQE